jgi:hypothetical protein
MMDNDVKFGRFNRTFDSFEVLRSQGFRRFQCQQTDESFNSQMSTRMPVY